MADRIAGTFTGVMRDSGARTVMVMDELKRRRDVLVEDQALQGLLRDRLERRLFPLIARGLGFGVTHIERYVVSCYDADDGAVFHAHRDSTTQGTAHRRFACSINLNDGFEGGDLRFPEYGPRTYRPPPGGATVFSCAMLHEATRVTRGRRYAFTGCGELNASDCRKTSLTPHHHRAVVSARRHSSQSVLSTSARLERHAGERM